MTYKHFRWCCIAVGFMTCAVSAVLWGYGVFVALLVFGVAIYGWQISEEYPDDDKAPSQGRLSA